jgi:hypothetical protein
MFDPMNTPHAETALAVAGAQDDSELLQGEVLRAALGFRSGEAFRAAIRAKRVPVKLVKLPGRRGWFARAGDVAHWKASVARAFEQSGNPKEGEHFMT